MSYAGLTRVSIDLREILFFEGRRIAGRVDKFRWSAQSRLLRPGNDGCRFKSRAQPLRATIEIQQFSYLCPRRLSVNFWPRPGGTAKCEAGCSIRRSVRSP